MPVTDIATIDMSSPIPWPTMKRNFVLANDFQFQRTVLGLLPPDSIVRAWLTIKPNPAQGDQAGPQAAIGLAPRGAGQVIADQNLCIFNVKAAQTALLNYGPEYYYDVKIQCTPSGNIYTVEQGYITFLPQITDAPISMALPSLTLPPLEPLLMTGPNNPNGAIVGSIGTRFWIVPPVPGQPSEYVNIDGGAEWRSCGEVSTTPPPVGPVPAIVIGNIPVIYYGSGPPPNGLRVPVGSRYWVTPPIPGLPGEYVAVDNEGTWKATCTVGLQGGDFVPGLPTAGGNYVWNADNGLWVPMGSVPGVTDGSNAAPGTIGEWLEQWGNSTGTTVQNDPQAADYNQMMNTPFTLPPGDWMVGGGFAIEQLGYPTSLVTALLGNVADKFNGSWCTLRAVTAQDVSQTFNPIRYNTTVPMQIGIFLSVVTWGSPSVSFPGNWDIWAMRIR